MAYINEMLISEVVDNNTLTPEDDGNIDISSLDSDNISASLDDGTITSVIDDNNINANLDGVLTVEIGQSYDYTQSINKPRINDIEIFGNQDASHYGLAKITDTRFLYTGTFNISRWQQIGNRYYYTVLPSVHALGNPVVCTVISNNGTEICNNFFSYRRLPNMTIQFISESPYEGQYIIKGEI